MLRTKILVAAAVMGSAVVVGHAALTYRYRPKTIPVAAETDLSNRVGSAGVRGSPRDQDRVTTEICGDHAGTIVISRFPARPGCGDRTRGTAIVNMDDPVMAAMFKARREGETVITAAR